MPVSATQSTDLVTPRKIHASPLPMPTAANVVQQQAQEQGTPDPNQPPAQSDDSQAQPDASQAQLPADLVQFPFLHALMAGSPPAVSFNAKGIEDKEIAQKVKEHREALIDAGFGFFRPNPHQGVLFNMLYIHPEDLKAASKAGKLHVLAPDVDVVNHAVAKSGLSNPILNIKNLPGGFAQQRSFSPPAASQAAPGQAAGSSPVPTPSPMPARPMAAGAQRKLTASRVSSLQPGTPLQGPEPGAGRLLNAILKPVV